MGCASSSEALLEAIKEDKVEEVQAILEKCENDTERFLVVTQRDPESKQGDNALHDVARQGRIAMLKVLICAATGIQIQEGVPMRVMFPQPPVLSALSGLSETSPAGSPSGSPVGQKYLVGSPDYAPAKVKALLDEKNGLGHTPLHCSCNKRLGDFQSTIEFLLRCGASPNTWNNVGSTPLHAMVTAVQSEITFHPSTLPPATQPQIPENTGLTKEKLDHLKPPLGASADSLLHSPVEKSVTPDMIKSAATPPGAALTNPRGLTISIPLESDVDEGVQDSFHNHVLVKAIRTLVEFGADPDALSSKGKSPLDMALGILQQLPHGVSVDNLARSAFLALGGIEEAASTSHDGHHEQPAAPVEDLDRWSASSGDEDADVGVQAEVAVPVAERSTDTLDLKPAASVATSPIHFEISPRKAMKSASTQTAVKVDSSVSTSPSREAMWRPSTPFWKKKAKNELDDSTGFRIHAQPIETGPMLNPYTPGTTPPGPPMFAPQGPIHRAAEPLYASCNPNSVSVSRYASIADPLRQPHLTSFAQPILISSNENHYSPTRQEMSNLKGQVTSLIHCVELLASTPSLVNQSKQSQAVSSAKQLHQEPTPRARSPSPPVTTANEILGSSTTPTENELKPLKKKALPHSYPTPENLRTPLGAEDERQRNTCDALSPTRLGAVLWTPNSSVSTISQKKTKSPLRSDLIPQNKSTPEGSAWNLHVVTPRRSTTIASAVPLVFPEKIVTDAKAFVKHGHHPNQLFSGNGDSDEDHLDDGDVIVAEAIECISEAVKPFGELQKVLYWDTAFAADVILSDPQGIETIAENVKSGRVVVPLTAVVKP